MAGGLEQERTAVAGIDDASTGRLGRDGRRLVGADDRDAVGTGITRDADSDRAVRGDLLAYDAVRSLGGEHEVDAERPTRGRRRRRPPRRARGSARSSPGTRR